MSFNLTVESRDWVVQFCFPNQQIDTSDTSRWKEVLKGICPEKLKHLMTPSTGKCSWLRGVSFLKKAKATTAFAVVREVLTEERKKIQSSFENLKRIFPHKLKGLITEEMTLVDIRERGEEIITNLVAIIDDIEGIGPLSKAYTQPIYSLIGMIARLEPKISREFSHIFSTPTKHLIFLQSVILKGRSSALSFVQSNQELYQSNKLADMLKGLKRFVTDKLDGCKRGSEEEANYRRLLEIVSQDLNQLHSEKYAEKI